MKITPAAIRSQSFETSFRGFEKKEVTAFLDEVSQVVEQLNQENLELKSKLQQVEAEAKRLKDVEDSLFRTLKTAEDTGASIIEEANEAADQIIAEANHTAKNATAHVNQMMEEAKKKAEENAATIIGAAEAKAKETIIELRESMQGLVRSYEGLAEQREALVKSLKRISQDTLNQLDLAEAHYSRIDAKAHQRAIDELSRSHTFTFGNLANLAAQAPEPQQPQDEYVPESVEEDPLEEMETVEEAIDLEMHDSAPDVVEADEEVEVENEEREEEVEEVVDQEEEIQEEEPVKEEIKAQEVREENEPEDPKKQSGSFFDQFD
ncbi:MAG TPA: hypothetical protein DEQ87_04480 [Algoriphagus sp.]|jgi:cell division initiation protein|uniref:DivIVA domain-containing protein n=1 Tax=unclassified Algoriphagus TaxID=2641541 RepID=UPI000C4CB63E|nr:MULTISPECIES: DivIVA domain-containing protein [unclassified Algoriphagus]MAL12524.1 hypothetical protein [Algoriphagus sp.]QYH38036.1 DivIVA domain-containing protein [Algoriphagus sp. NBT04N3]HAS57839.1 hypothetical protein [Algoriphagus sp.]HCB47760.1 hypothetical protein [Algoriphagus sp.]HCD86883.1 hypothetical protein [Algoriphagus sp.]|tara:strand:+ start:5366 stop:6331 length:966 start_codon:yes stop_codon:yes gene_type:complete